jgi:DNA-binding LacI/PurR family transcriptional regulator
MKKEKFIPIYEQIFEELKEKITKGELKPDDPIPTQLELAAIYNTSEITSRRALTELAKEGLIYRVKGKGSFVNNRPLEEDLKDSAVKQIYFVYPSTSLNVFDHKFFSNLLNGIYEICEDNGIQFSTWEVGPDFTLPVQPEARYIVMTHVPGSGDIPIDVLKQWKTDNRFMINVSFYYPHLFIPYVLVDSLTGGYLATQHLLELGHKRIGIILTGKSTIELNQEFSLRLQGYKLALSQHQIPFDPELICVLEGKYEAEEMGYKGCNQLLSKPNPPTAIFSTSDYKAMGVYKAARERGLEIPKDLSIIGYDDVTLSQYVSPPLTTVNQNSKKLGQRAAELLLYEYNDLSSTNILKDEIVPSLIVRGSTAEYQGIKKINSLN